MRRVLWSGLLGALALFAGAVPAADLYVIAALNTEITAEDIRQIYLGEKQFGGPTRLIPVENAAAQSAFLGKVMKMESARYSANWVKKSFREALNPPAIKASDTDVVEYVKRTAGAVGYVTKLPANVMVVQQF